MRPDPHEDYYARKQAHRAELFSALNWRRGAGSKARKPYIVAAVLLVIATSGWAGWMGLFG